MRSSNIIESKKISDVLKECKFNSFVIFDLDNTLMNQWKKLALTNGVQKSSSYQPLSFPVNRKLSSWYYPFIMR